jgi:4-methylaminobutanoate oxidase (formaldehyde-forming)
MGYVVDPSGITSRDWVLGGTYEIEVAGERVAARVSLEPFYDPKSLRVKA